MESHDSYNEAIESMRQREYPMLQGSVYLDHAGSALCPKSLMDAFAADITSNLYGNPHSASWPSQRSASRIEDIRLRLMNFFNADPTEYDLVFVQNATAGVKLVVEGLRALPGGYRFAHHESCHTSLVGAREEARESACLDDAAVDKWIAGEAPFGEVHDVTLFAYTAQSHMDGQRFPLSWSRQLKESDSTYTLLDAASLCATSPLDMGHPDFGADFTVLSLYKIFGFPDLGALLVRHSAASVFNHRRYFGGGTVDMVVCGREQWHAPKSASLHERLEDGTLPFHNIMAVDHALKTHRSLFGSMRSVSSHAAKLARRLHRGLAKLRHGNAEPVCTIYGPELTRTTETGPIVSFNIKGGNGAWVSLAEFDKLAVTRGMHVRTGGLCSPGGIASALSLEPWEMRRNFSSGFRCGTENDIVASKPTGVIRASLGVMSTISDVDRFVRFIDEYFREDTPQIQIPRQITSSGHRPRLRVKTITVFPIKSCGGMDIPPDTPWDVRPEGLAWDREWCLVHRGSGHALSQKRYPKMALLRPQLDLEDGLLRVSVVGGDLSSIEIPLSQNPALYTAPSKSTPSRVCGDEISTQTYASEVINTFFSEALGVPCFLARFPAGGRGLQSRSSKAQVQRYQQRPRLPGSFPDNPSPPDSDSEQSRQDKILLSNESPILMIHTSSLDALNETINSQGDEQVEQAAFRANIVVEGSTEAYAEDTWSSISIGTQHFKMLGACRRCQMVCVDQSTGQRRQEPLSTLAKTRRFDGKVYFGIHMRHERSEGSPTIQIGASVVVDEI